ncbi:GTPase HflX [Amphibiibacter pelophylacis]|uniref:GTPase HflX n=1 Tax=Amphibiibacter pelophylacis TaxID=1799477 RepID=A0ACC6P2L4_9BURK
MSATAVPTAADLRPAVVLVGVEFGRDPHFDAELTELALLAETAGDRVADRVSVRRASPDPSLFIGSGKADEIKALVSMHGAVGVIFDQALSPAQQRNLERHFGVAVSDRTALILEIFAQRAQSHEGKLQVELAQLQYLSSRLVRRWTHLERQTGGAGQRGGPGETQIELDRRMIAERIKAIKLRLVKVRRQRDTQRRSRKRSGAARISLIGYTNAGKSTLFNALVKAQAYAADQLFATLDTTTRACWLADLGASVSLSDTVGFIRDLPHRLVEAFAATLQEAADADVLLHVIDGSRADWHEQCLEVERVLDGIGAQDIAQILVFNKADLLEPDQQPRSNPGRFERLGQSGAGTWVPSVYVSAQTGAGLDVLRSVIAQRVLGLQSSSEIQDSRPDSGVYDDPAEAASAQEEGSADHHLQPGETP